MPSATVAPSRSPLTAETYRAATCAQPHARLYLAHSSLYEIYFHVHAQSLGRILHTLCSTAAADNAPKITIEQINDGSFSPQYIYGVHPLNDGESYSQLSADGRRITRSSFKTGQETGVLFDLDKARGTAKLERIDGYIMSPDEKKILLRTKTTPVYRRTSLAVYYIYDVANDKYEPLSEGGPQMSPLFSPDGNVVAFAPLTTISSS